jgi:hypothetical protein
LIQCFEGGSKPEVDLVHEMLENNAGLRIFIVYLEKPQGEAAVGHCIFEEHEDLNGLFGSFFEMLQVFEIFEDLFKLDPLSSNAKD